MAPFAVFSRYALQMNPNSQLHSLVSAHYLLGRQWFTPEDWQTVEQSRGVLRPGMRATAWICNDGVTPALIDWQPPPDG